MRVRRPSATTLFSFSPLLLAGLLVLPAPLAAQEESPPSEETAPQEPPTEEAPSEEEPSDDQQEPRELTPEEAKREEARIKREERAAKRQAKKDREAEKAEDKVSKGEANYEDQLNKLLSKGYAALEAGRFKNALQAFNTRLGLENDIDFEARMGRARTLFAMDRQVEAIEEALKASRDAEESSDSSDALVFAGDLALRSVPRDEVTNAPLPGSELYVTTAWRYYIQALQADPQGAEEARSRLDEIFPTPPDERTERLYGRYLDLVEGGYLQHARYLAAAYEALITGGSTEPVAVAGGITAPTKSWGKRPTYPRPKDEPPPKRLVASFIVETDGTVSDVRILNGVSRRLNQDARKVWMEWTFEPARLPDGTPVPVHYLAGASPIITEPPAEPPSDQETTPDEAEEDTEVEEEAGEGEEETAETGSEGSDDSPTDDPPSDDPPDEGEPEADH